MRILLEHWYHKKITFWYLFIVKLTTNKQALQNARVSVTRSILWRPSPGNAGVHRQPDVGGVSYQRRQGQGLRGQIRRYVVYVPMLQCVTTLCLLAPAAAMAFSPIPKCDDVMSMSSDIITCTDKVLGSNMLVASKSVMYDL